MADASLTDPLGRTVVLHDHTWYGHVLKRHPDVRMLRRFAEQAVTAPVAISFSKSEVDCRLYFGSTPASGIMVAVVADVAIGVVKTAYRVVRVTGTQEWPPPPTP
jgi:hypothetical protein